MSDQVFAVFNRNVGNKLTEELATGMASAIVQERNQYVQQITEHFTARIDELQSQLAQATMAPLAQECVPVQGVDWGFPEGEEKNPAPEGFVDEHVSSEDIAAKEMPERGARKPRK